MSGLLMDERFVAVFPSLVRLLGSIESAVILQHIHFNADANGEAAISAQQISDETGITVRTVRRRLEVLREDGYLKARRTSTFDSTNTYEIDLAKLTSTSSQNAEPEVANLATSEVANLATSSTSKNVRTTTPSPKKVGSVTRADLPDDHPSRRLPKDWQPSRPTVAYVRQEFPELDHKVIAEGFVSWNASKGETSKNWDLRFVSWVAMKYEKWSEQQRGGTDDLGVPLSQRKSGETSGPDEEEAEELRRLALEAARARPPQ